MVPQRLQVWYRYPREAVPRVAAVELVHQGSSIADGVARAIARDCGLRRVALSRTPTLELLEHLRATPNADMEYALRYASIVPHVFVPDPAHIPACGKRTPRASIGTRGKRPRLA